MELKMIDVSSYQGKPDWAKVAASGIKGAILRVHQRNGIDTSFEYNYKGCRSSGLLAGVYKFSYALTEAQALEEAEDVLKVLDGRKLDFPVFYDLEWSSQRKLGNAAVEKIAVVFLKRIKKAGYRVGIYCNMDWYQNVLSTALKKYDCWLARYPANDDGTVHLSLKPPKGIGWQYSSKGTVPGITGNTDMNIFYKDYSDSSSSTSPAAGGRYMFEPETVRKGSTGASVLLLQEILAARGFKGKDGKVLILDRSAGTNTIHALNQYKKSRKMAQNGICDAATWKDLIAI